MAQKEYVTKIDLGFSFDDIKHVFVNICTDIDKEQEPSDKQVNLMPDMGPNFDRLWSYSCKLTAGRNVERRQLCVVRKFCFAGQNVAECSGTQFVKVILFCR